jgi:hypothetical protein
VKLRQKMAEPKNLNNCQKFRKKILTLFAKDSEQKE